VIGCVTCQSKVLLGAPWPRKAVIESNPFAIILKVWIRETVSQLAVSTVKFYVSLYLVQITCDQITKIALLYLMAIGPMSLFAHLCVFMAS